MGRDVERRETLSSFMASELLKSKARERYGAGRREGEIE